MHNVMDESFVLIYNNLIVFLITLSTSQKKIDFVFSIIHTFEVDNLTLLRIMQRKSHVGYRAK